MLTKRVSEKERRRLFNEGRYYEWMLAGEFKAIIESEIPRRRGDRRIRGSKSQVVESWDKSGVLIAPVHQYRKQDGSLEASGRPDPKRLRHEGVLYRLDTSEDWDISNW